MRNGIAILTLTIAFLAIAGAVSFSPPCQPPGSENKQQSADAKENCPSLLRVYSVFAFTKLHEYREDINAASTLVIAIFTVVLGIFTVRLSGSTRRAADAAVLSSRAAIKIQLPIIRAAANEFVISDNKELSGGTIVHNPFIYKTSFARLWDFSFRNIGTSTAYPSEYGFGWSTNPALPTEPIYEKIITVNPAQIIAVNDSWSASLDGWHIEISDEMRSYFKSGQIVVRIFCFLKYVDFLDDEHEARFVWSLRKAEHTERFFLRPDHTAPAAYTRKT